MNDTLSIALAADSHVGRQRTLNEDAWATFDLPGCDRAFVLADGMGGLRSGDRASQEAVRVVEAVLRERIGADSDAAAVDSALQEAFARANDAVLALAVPGAEEPTQSLEEGGGRTLMGTTAVAGVVRDGVLHLAHAGDSRAYLLRDHDLVALTEDHSFVAERVRAGDMTEAEARRSRFRNMVTRAIGIDSTVVPDLHRETLRPGDLCLVCTDGLTTMVPEAMIAALLEMGGAPEALAASLIATANQRGGFDNTTVLVLTVRRPDEPAPPPSRGRSTPSARAVRSAAVARGGDVLDMDAPPRRRRERGRPAPMLVALAAIGLAALASLLVLSLSDPLRVSVARRLAKIPPPVEKIPSPDYVSLTYDIPQRVDASYLFRNTHLAWSPHDGLAIVSSTDGDVVRVDAAGHIDRSVRPQARVPVPDRESPAAKALPEEVYFALDPQGNLYVSSPSRRVIEKFDTSGKKRATIGPGTGKAKLTAPRAVAVDDKGNVWFVDQGYLMKAEAKDPVAASPAPPTPGP